MLENHCFQKQGIFSVLDEECDPRIVNICIFIYMQHVNYNKTKPVEMLVIKMLE